MSRCCKVNFYFLHSEMHPTPTSGLYIRHIFLYFSYVLMFDKTALGYSWEFLVRVCRLQILTLFQTKKCNFPHPFSDLACWQKLYYHYLD